MTKQRELILQIIRSSDRHLTAEEIYLLAQAQLPGIVRATVYNNLNALAATGEIARLHTAGGADRFDRTVRQHFHLICDKCGSIRDVACLTDPARELEEMYPVKIRFVEMNAYYTCENCRHSPERVSHGAPDPSGETCVADPDTQHCLKTEN